MPVRVINLSVLESGAGMAAAYSYHLRLDAAVLASNQTLDTAQSRAVRELSHQYGELFEQQWVPQLAQGALAAIGSELFDLWLGPLWAQLSAQLKPVDQRVLVIASDRPAVLNLPWELLRPPGGEAIGADARWSLRRLPWAERQLDRVEAALPAGPLRVLHMVAAPQDQEDLDFEREEELLLRALGAQVVFDTGDLGSFEELGQRINAFRPHIVHLTGHGAAGETSATFAFEDERGRTDARSAAELGQLFAGSDVQCAFLSACQAGRAPERTALGGLAQGLLEAGVPLVIGWTASVLDDVAIDVAAGFYNAIASGQGTVDRSLVIARQKARKACDLRGDPSWSLPVLYASTTQAKLFDPMRAEPSPRPSLVQQPLPGMVEGYTPHFIGRRRELQRLLPGLRTNELQVVMLTGLGGAGKSTLATQLARKLEADGFVPLAISSSSIAPLSAEQLLQVCGDVFLTSGQDEVYARLQNAALPVDARLRQVVAGLNRGRFVLVLDNFESNLDEASRRILNAEVAAFYTHLLSNLSGGSRVIVSSRYLPADVATLPPTATELILGEFSEAAFLKFLLRDAAVEQRYRAGRLPHDLLVRLHQVLGATPRFVGQIRAVLAEMSAQELTAELDRVAMPAATEKPESPGRLQAVRDKYCEDIFTGRLYGRLPDEVQRMLSQAAVYGLPVTLEGLAAVAGVSAETARGAAEQGRVAALLHVDTGSGRSLWSVYGMLRGWLLAPERLDADARRASQAAAGDFLVALDKQNRAGDLGVTWIACLLEARAQYLAAGSLNQARQVTDQISGYYQRQGLYTELERLHQELLEREEHSKTLNWLGQIHSQLAQYESARTYMQRALVLAGETDLEQASMVLHNLASIELQQGAYPAAREGFGKALAIRQQIGDRDGEAGTLYQLASIDFQQGAYSAARNGSRKALEIKRQIGEQTGEAAALHLLASIDLQQGHYQAARAGLGQALAILQQIGNRVGEAKTLHQLASIDLRTRAYPAARARFDKALTIFRQTGDRTGEATVLHQLASIDLHEGADFAAQKGLVLALAIRQEIGDRAGEAATWQKLGSVAIHRNKVEDGLRLLALCFLIEHEIGHGNAARDCAAVMQTSQQLDYTPDRIKAMLQEVRESYARDRGITLLRVASL